MNAGCIWLSGWSFGGEVFRMLRELLPAPAADLTVDYTKADHAEQFYTLAAAEIEALRSRLDAGTPLVAIGWSLGGMLALRLAAEGLVDGAVVMSAGARFVRSDRRVPSAGSGEEPRPLKRIPAAPAADRGGWDARQLKRMRAALAANRDAVEARFHSMALGNSMNGMRQQASRWSDAALDAGLEWLMNADLNSLLPSIECPILIIHGADDCICPADLSADLLTTVTQAERLLLEGGGHVPFLAEPTLVSARIRRWLHDRLS